MPRPEDDPRDAMHHPLSPRARFIMTVLIGLICGAALGLVLTELGIIPTPTAHINVSASVHEAVVAQAGERVSKTNYRNIRRTRSL